MKPNTSLYKPDPLLSGGSTQKPFQENTVPITGSIIPTLLRLAMRRIPGFGHGMIHNGPPSTVKTPAVPPTKIGSFK